MLLQSRLARHRPYTATLLSVIAGSIAAAAPAYAIPSPELVVGSITSLSQLVALASALLGGGALVAGRRVGRRATVTSVWQGRMLVGLAALCVVSLGCNVWQVMEQQRSRLVRLQATLVRPALAPHEKPADLALKEIPYRVQTTHPLGLQTTEIAALLDRVDRGEADETLLLDIRETAEIASGGMPYTRAVRYPDLDREKLRQSGKKLVLFCHNGNRSAETCEALAANGIDCRFMIGGMEKWLSEQRPLVGGKARSLDDLRALPDFPNSGTFLETDDVRRLLTAEHAILVDVRYPGEFERTHLEGAVNLPIRPVPSEILKHRLADLPQRPVIAPCYDRRSCFFAQILGLELTRMGRDYRGRYTTPWELFKPPQPPPHIVDWQRQQSTSSWSRAAEALAAALTWTAGHTGLPLALVALAALSRLLVLPMSIKAERDQITTVRVADEFEALRRRLAADPARLARATAAFYRRHGLTPVRNLVALLFLPVLALAVEAARLAASANPESVLWLADLSLPDPTFALPILLAVLITAYIDLCFARSTRTRLLIWIGGICVFTATGAMLSAAADLYIAASGALLLLQRVVVTGALARWVAGLWQGRLWQGRRRPPVDGVIPLDRHELLTGAGNKAFRLARIISFGMPVPDGVVLTQGFLDRWQQLSPDAKRRSAAGLWRQLGGKPLAVRSSAGAEDGAGASFAGVFESVIDVDRDRLVPAIDRVRASFAAARVTAYAADSGSHNILLQRMFDAEFCGVLFTRDPQAPGLTLVETVEGGLDKLVAGRVTPASRRFCRISGLEIIAGGIARGGASRSDDDRPAIARVDLEPLIAIARRIESEFGCPQDIEWACRRGRFVILQSRDITSTLTKPKGAGKPSEGEATALTAEDAVTDEWLRLSSLVETSRNQRVTARRGSPPRSDEVVLARGDIAELLPRPTPLSLSLLEAMWTSGGSIDLAARAIGGAIAVAEDAPPLHVTVFGRLYLDAREEASRMLRLSRLARRRLERTSFEIERHFRREVVSEVLARVRLLEAVDFHRLPSRDLMAAWSRTVDAFIHLTHTEVDIVNIAASTYLAGARAALQSAGLEPAQVLAEGPSSLLSRRLAVAASVAGSEERRASLLACVGHRATVDYELADPRLAEDPSGLDAFVAAAVPVSGTPSAGRSRNRPTVADPDADFGPCLTAALDDRRLRSAVKRAQRFQALKEDAKDIALRELAVLRRIALAIDRRFDLGGLVFFCTLSEIGELSDRASSLRSDLAARSRTRERLLARPPLGRSLTLAEIEMGPLAVATGANATPSADASSLRGTRVAGGSGVVEGRAHVVSAEDAELGAALDGFVAGDIIVTPLVHAAWLPQVLQAAAVVSELGGWLSHMAIVAREHAIPMVVGVPSLASIRHGNRIRIEADGRIVDLGAVDIGTVGGEIIDGEFIEDELPRLMAAQ